VAVHLYVYYRVSPRAAAKARVLAGRVLEQARSSVRQCALRRRPQTKEGMETWMEVYEGVNDGPALLALLQRAVARSGLDRLTGERHLEWFEDLCA
jgi:hypothetical protein